MVMQPAIKKGVSIYTRDGDRIGTVKQARDGYIEVDAPMQPDYWLP